MVILMAIVTFEASQREAVEYCHVVIVIVMLMAALKINYSYSKHVVTEGDFIHLTSILLLLILILLVATTTHVVCCCMLHGTPSTLYSTLLSAMRMIPRILGQNQTNIYGRMILAITASTPTSTKIAAKESSKSTSSSSSSCPFSSLASI